MSLILALGSNLGECEENLLHARKELAKIYPEIKASQLFSSAAVEKLDQPDFLNQVIEYQLPNDTPFEVLRKINRIENQLGRIRKERYAARVIDIDIIFFGNHEVNHSDLQIPHPKWQERSFVVKPLQQLPFFETIQKSFTIVKDFPVDATPIK